MDGLPCSVVESHDYRLAINCGGGWSESEQIVHYSVHACTTGIKVKTNRPSHNRQFLPPLKGLKRQGLLKGGYVHRKKRTHAPRQEQLVGVEGGTIVSATMLIVGDLSMPTVVED